MIPTIQLQARLNRLSSSPCLTHEVFGVARYGGNVYPLTAFSIGGKELPAICIAAGVHGDEPCGVESALRLLESITEGAVPLIRHRLVVLPCVNPSGLEDATRSNRDGQDINRQFHADSTQENPAVRRVLKREGIVTLVDLHSDTHCRGFYLFQLLRADVESFAARFQIELLRRGYPLEETPHYGGYLGEQGLIAPTTPVLEAYLRRAQGSSLAEWGWYHGVPRNYVFETPGQVSFELGVALHLDALAILFAALEPGRESLTVK